MAGFSVRFGRPEGTQQVAAAIGAQLSKSIAQQVVTRVQNRVRHPAASTLRAVGTNQYSATVTGSRGGPGIIRPVRAKALWWPGARHPVNSVNGAGLLPLIVAEGARLSGRDETAIVQRIKID